LADLPIDAGLAAADEAGIVAAVIAGEGEAREGGVVEVVVDPERAAGIRTI
jgi:hypothetical protein